MRIKTDPTLPQKIGTATILPTLANVTFTTDDGAPLDDVCDCRITIRPDEPIFAWVKHIVTGLDVAAVKKEGEE